MEYPGRADRTWAITVYDMKDKPYYHEQNLTRDEAKRAAERWIRDYPLVNKVDVYDTEQDRREFEKMKRSQEDWVKGV